ncbi:nucleoredoxin-like protein 2 [Photinus pyralis]|nr:nucleoredoxin-like protein 2 [Photinus pyralis]
MLYLRKIPSLLSVLQQCKRYTVAIQELELINTNGNTIPGKTVTQNNKYIMYYFSASWCSGCKLLLPKIKSIYTESRNRQIPLEIIYISLDDNMEEMMKGFRNNHGNWFAIPFGSPVIEELRYRFEVAYVPFIAVLKNDGTIVTKNGKKEVEDLGINVLETWID